MCRAKLGSIPHGFGASTNAQWLHIPPSSDPGFQPTSQIWADKLGSNGMMIDPHPLPQHMKVVKCLVYVWSGCGIHSTGFGASTNAQGLHIPPSSDPGFHPTFQIWADNSRWKQHDNGLISPSTAYEACQMPCICWEQRAKVGSIPHGFVASTNAQGLHIPPSSDPGFQPTSQIWTYMNGGNGIMMDPFPLPQHMRHVKCLVYVWSGCGIHSTWAWVWSSTNAQGLHIPPSSDPGFQPTSQIWADKRGSNCMTMDPYPHPQHMKDVKCLVYVWSKGGIHSTWVGSLYQCTMASYTTKQ
jgi:hypothetical protein